VREHDPAAWLPTTIANQPNCSAVTIRVSDRTATIGNASGQRCLPG